MSDSLPPIWVLAMPCGPCSRVLGVIPIIADMPVFIVGCDLPAVCCTHDQAITAGWPEIAGSLVFLRHGVLWPLVMKMIFPENLTSERHASQTAAPTETGIDSKATGKLSEAVSRQVRPKVRSQPRSRGSDASELNWGSDTSDDF